MSEQLKLQAVRRTTVGFLLALASCKPQLVTPPAPTKDALPEITVGYGDATGLGPTPPAQISYTQLKATTTVDMPTKSSNHQIALWDAAHNPGGVQSVRMTLNNVDVATLTQLPDANGQVSPTIGIIGTDGAGGPGAQRIAFTNVGANVLVVTSSNFNGGLSHITITSVSHQLAP